jgi:hypothetical protein
MKLSEFIKANTQNIDEEMADKTRVDLDMFIEKAKAFRKMKVVQIENLMNEIKTRANALRTNSAYQQDVANADMAISAMNKFLRAQKFSAGQPATASLDLEKTLSKDKKMCGNK